MFDRDGGIEAILKVYCTTLGIAPLGVIAFIDIERSSGMLGLKEVKILWRLSARQLRVGRKAEAIPTNPVFFA